MPSGVYGGPRRPGRRRDTREAGITTEKNYQVTSSAPEFSSTGALWVRLVALHSQVDAIVERALQRHFGIGLSEFLALAACAAAPDGEMRMQDLTEAVFLNQSSVSRMVTRLERIGLLERRICEHDRRGVYTGITPRGLEVLHEAIPVYEAVLREAFDRSAADLNLATLVEHLKALRT